MKIWYDACTGKHVRYGVAIAKRLRKLGHEVILTTRKHPDTIALANILGEKFVVVGKYDPASPSTRLQESAKRTLFFCKTFSKNVPDIAISHGSVELCRVAFGLNVPVILTADAPHATAANKLTLPLVDVLVLSKAIPKRIFQRYGVRKIVQFKGVDEISWVRDYKPEKLDYERPLIVVRQLETKASYAKQKSDATEKLARKLASFGHVLFLPRFDGHPRKGLTVLRKYVDSVSLAANADIVVSAGGTIAREAALQGTPSIAVPLFGRFHTNDFLAKLGFPLFTVKIQEVQEHVKKFIGLKWDVEKLQRTLENPVDVIERIIKGAYTVE